MVANCKDDSIIETDRLKRCPCVHAYYDPRLDAVNYVPICSWRLHNKKILRQLSELYAAEKPKPEPKKKPDAAATPPRQIPPLPEAKPRTATAGAANPKLQIPDPNRAQDSKGK